MPRGTLLSVVALALAVVASGVLLVAPTYAGEGVSSGAVVSGSAGAGDGGLVQTEVTRVTTRSTLLEANGPGVLVALVALAVPVVLAGLGLAMGWSTWPTVGRATSAVLLGLFAFVTGFSIGMFYVPSALAMGLATLWRPRGA